MSRRPTRATRRAQPTRAVVHDSASRRLLFGLAGCGALLGAWAGGGLPGWLLAWYAVCSAVTFLLYWHDKRAARTQRWRTPERSLQLLALAGGWPGALLAQAALRHKHRKADFQWVFLLCVIANVACVLLLIRQFALAG